MQSERQNHLLKELYLFMAINTITAMLTTKNIYTRIRVKSVMNMGYFKCQLASTTRGSGCPKCKTGGYDRTSFIDICERKEKLAELYLIKCSNDNETFIKVGITSNSTEERFNNSKLMPYEFSIISRVKGIPLEIWDLEKKLNAIAYISYYKPKDRISRIIRECFLT